MALTSYGALRQSALKQQTRYSAALQAEIGRSKQNNKTAPAATTPVFNGGKIAVSTTAKPVASSFKGSLLNIKA